MRRPRVALLGAVLLLPLLGGAAHAVDPAAKPALSLTGKVPHPQQFDLGRLRALPSQQVQVSYKTEQGDSRQASFTGVLLWALIGEAGGIDDQARGAVLRHVIKITALDGYVVVLSTGEIAPDFGNKPALIAYQSDTEAPGTGGLWLVMPGDKLGGRYVHDVVAIDVE